ncbi:MAG: low molecular weight protein-tyrosine-phosphatase [Chitinophagales bacterium]
MKILMVCLGNICRSPLAEGILRHKAQQAGLNWIVDSAGTGAWHVGEQPDKRSMAIAKKYGIDLSYQRARQFQASDFENYDVIYAMDSQNYNDILRKAPDEGYHGKVKLILNESKPGYNQAVPDPYWNDNGFQHVYDLLNEACEHIVRR